jgi:hypothetical protein
MVSFVYSCLFCSTFVLCSGDSAHLLNIALGFQSLKIFGGKKMAVAGVDLVVSVMRGNMHKLQNA